MNEVARRIRARLGCAWPAHLDARVGMEAFGHALEALGLYDDDFRPDAERLAALRKADELERLATPRGADG